MSGVPLQQECNPDDPEEHLLWSYTKLPLKLVDGAYLVTMPEVLRKWSKQQYDAGFRHHPELQTIEFVPPAGGITMYGPPGEWLKTEDAAKRRVENAEATQREFENLKDQVLASMPEYAARVDSMTPEEKAAAREDAKSKLTESLSEMQSLLDVLNQDTDDDTATSGETEES
ncbi:hypothetical protein C1M55_24285 [Rhodococcus qingshengii]|uniref:phage gene 29 protein family protein n=1 Tax=Rhodococcus qingshengii TaxID=334542 RepID=UPI000C9F81C0|nr:DUF2744 domain-containing protein [Rhodococcus qingshengii]AUS33906.1 hypothetical protein C1M55_24285 [Rhodococcus qingshengii]